MPAEKLKIDRPIIVEGKYDRIRLLSVVEGEIITTDGFGIFRSEEKRLMLRRIAEKKGVLVLTDSDGGGLVIRNHLRGILPKEKVTHLYIPEIRGKEKRKDTPSREGLLGVEGIDCDRLREILSPFAVSDSETRQDSRKINKIDFFEAGLSGDEGSAEKRKSLCRAAGLPTNLSANALLEALNLLYSYNEFLNLVKQTEGAGTNHV